MMNYLCFLLKSSNQHGIHSPFVYNYLTKGLYEVKKKAHSPLKKTDAFYLKTLEYFNPKVVAFFEPVPNLQQLLEKTAFKSVVAFEKEQYDVVCANASILTKDAIKSLLSFFHNDTIGIIDKRNCSAAAKQALDVLLESDTAITLVLNFYHYSIISIRREQLKENFYLRM